jgi:hypothetical protein
MLARRPAPNRDIPPPAIGPYAELKADFVPGESSWQITLKLKMTPAIRDEVSAAIAPIQFAGQGSASRFRDAGIPDPVSDSGSPGGGGRV